MSVSLANRLFATASTMRVPAHSRYLPFGFQPYRHHRWLERSRRNDRYKCEPASNQERIWPRRIRRTHASTLEDANNWERPVRSFESTGRCTALVTPSWEKIPLV